MSRKIEIYDTTLRDGAQTEGISFSVKDKLAITKKLDEFGIHYIEGGWPGSNPKDMEYFDKVKKLRLKNSKIVAFGSTRKPGIKVGKDKNLQALLKAGTEYITVFGKSWDLHVHKVLRTGLQENLDMIFDTVSYLKKRGFKVFFDAEHFFDGYRENPEYALKTLQAAGSAGADLLVLCDTNGGMLPSWIGEIIREVKSRVETALGIHAHNDTGMAVANSIQAIQEGCVHVQGTINGYGERCGNADLCVILPNIKLKLGLNCIRDDNLKKLTELSHFVAEVSNMKPVENQPYVGGSAFTHKGGVHINAVMKDPRTYEHILPEAVGNKRKLLVSELSGKSSIVIKAQEYGFQLDKNKKITHKLHKLLQELEHKGYHFEAAEGSFELLLKKQLGKLKKFFTLESFRVIVEKRKDESIISEATIKLRVNNKPEYTVAEGDGPVNALDKALRKALHQFYPVLAEMRLADFKVRVLDEKAGTAAKVRVLIQSQDSEESWATIGVSENIIEASWQALLDSIEYKLMKENQKGRI
ncbi:MAG: citramalate synthase [Candidatus Omnitrophica bacterium 4484_49]|nr:citramalate synthase [Candidatus Omnitrophota bacterium]OQX83476.1 MAG: citramalate synthase [Candidatus Omnitrophica bacterium 4484_49]